MHPIGVAGRNVNAAKIVLAVPAAVPNCRWPKVIVHGGRTLGKADIALEIRVLHSIHRREDAIKVINLELTVAVAVKLAVIFIEPELALVLASLAESQTKD